MADEVRSLALRAAEAAKNTSNLIENTIKAVRSGSDLTQTTKEAFNENMEISQKVGHLVDEISAASNEQAQGIEEINKAVTEMDKVVQQVAANAEESASASEVMSAQAEQMKANVGELMTLVGGVKKWATASKQAMAGEGDMRRKEALPAPQRRAVKKDEAVQKKREARKLIPLDDEDFKDF